MVGPVEQGSDPPVRSLRVASHAGVAHREGDEVVSFAGDGVGDAVAGTAWTMRARSKRGFRVSPQECVLDSVWGFDKDRLAGDPRGVDESGLYAVSHKAGARITWYGKDGRVGHEIDCAGGEQGGSLFGVPLGDLGWFARRSRCWMGSALGFAAFFAATFLGIFGILIYNTAMHGSADFAWSYWRVGLPVGATVMALALWVSGDVVGEAAVYSGAELCPVWIDFASLETVAYSLKLLPA